MELCMNQCISKCNLETINMKLTVCSYAVTIECCNQVEGQYLLDFTS